LVSIGIQDTQLLELFVRFPDLLSRRVVTFLIGQHFGSRVFGPFVIENVVSYIVIGLSFFGGSAVLRVLGFLVFSVDV
jgi:hypothetical protein